MCFFVAFSLGIWGLKAPYFEFVHAAARWLLLLSFLALFHDKQHAISPWNG
jgi:hypothetical protein